MSGKYVQLRKIQQLYFMMIEAGLFLDNQKECGDAGNTFDEYRKLYLQAKCEYEKTYGPLTYEGVDFGCSGWSWVEGPWPWEGEC